jgi:phosphoribosylformylglycinamidine cyclo-ligase
LNLTYKDSGVDIQAGNKLIDNLKPLALSTFDKNVLGGLGSFSGGYKIPNEYKNPILFSATDGVGTKLKLSIDSKRFDGIGIDLVAMIVNDLICSFAKPMFFLDYYATAKLDINEATKVIGSIAKGCKEAGCSLIGGETAEMPGLYQKNDFDLAGFGVGMAEEEELKNKEEIKEGDVLIGLVSSGIHSNGYSLIRKLCFEKLNMNFDDLMGDKKLIDVLLEPTKIYVKDFLKVKDKVKALAHITGGGFVENIPRILNKGFGARIIEKSIPKQDIYEFLKQHIQKDELYKTFNMGAGLVMVCSQKNASWVLDNLDGFILGEIILDDNKSILID